MFKPCTLDQKMLNDVSLENDVHNDHEIPLLLLHGKRGRKTTPFVMPSRVMDAG